MGKVVTLILMLVLLFVSLAGYVILTNKIMAGNQKILVGEKQIEQGEQMLARGKQKLASGQQDLSQIKNMSKGTKMLPIIGAVTLPVSAGLYVVTKSTVDDGNQQVLRGQQKIKAGEEQLAAGKLELAHGKARLSLANKIRVICGVATIFFACLFFVLVICWRRVLFKKDKFATH